MFTSQVLNEIHLNSLIVQISELFSYVENFDLFDHFSKD